MGVHDALVDRSDWRVCAEDRDYRGDEEHEPGRCWETREHARRAVHARRDGPLERLEHRVVVPRAIVADPVDEQGWRTRNAVRAPGREILLDARAHFIAPKVAFEAIDIEADPTRELENVRLVERRLAAEQPVVHLEETPLSGG